MIGLARIHTMTIARGDEGIRLVHSEIESQTDKKLAKSIEKCIDGCDGRYPDCVSVYLALSVDKLKVVSLQIGIYFYDIVFEYESQRFQTIFKYAKDNGFVDRIFDVSESKRRKYIDNIKNKIKETEEEEIESIKEYKEHKLYM